MKVVFIIGAPRSGTTMLEHILSSHSMIHGGPEPHIVTPLAHLGVWAKVDKAPYDHIVAAMGQRAFVNALPDKEKDYWDACRAYCDTLYGRCLSNTGKEICLDKTPEYATILPFLFKIYPDARYIVLTRHPIAIYSSFANSFFDGDYQKTNEHDPLLRRYVPALAWSIRQKNVPILHVRYEDLVQTPASWTEKICEFMGIPFEAASVEYGERENLNKDGLGDPLGVQKYSRPTTDSVTKWAKEFSMDQEKRSFMEQLLSELDSDDLKTIGYPADKIWQPVDELAGNTVNYRKPRLNAYRMQRKVIVRSRSLIRRNSTLENLVRRVQLICDVLLREY